MRRRTRLLAAGAAFLAVVTAGMVTAPPAGAHHFLRFGFGFPVFFAPPPPPPPVVYPYGYRYRYRRVLVRHYYRRVHYRHRVRHHWCSCHCCR